jgi:predicted transcriptional regulator
MLKPKLILKSVKSVDHAATGASVKQYREKMGVGQGCVAEEMGQNYLTIVSNLESGKRVWTEKKLNLVLDAIISCAEKFPVTNKSGKTRKVKTNEHHST